MQPDSFATPNTLDELTRDACGLLEAMLRIPALSRQEGPRADFLATALLERGLSPERHGHNLILRLHGSGSENVETLPCVWLVSHLDTVPPSGSWVSDPYTGVFEEGRLTGLGSNDAGASLISMLAVFRLFHDALKTQAVTLPFQLIWIAAAEEEVSGAGGIESLLGILPEADLVLVGEPTGMKAAVAEKGLLVMDGVVKGKAGHAAHGQGDNAIYNALGDLEWFRTYRLPLESEFLGQTRMNVTVLQAGQSHNAVPAECRYTVDVRLTDRYSHQDVLDVVREHVRAEITARSTRLKPSVTPPDHPVQAALDQLGIERYGSPTLSDQALIPYPSLKMGPGDSTRSHAAQEFILESEIRDAIPLYTRLLLETWRPDDPR